MMTFSQEIALKKTKMGEPTGVEIIEQSIMEIAGAMKKINSARLTRKALVILISASCGVGKTVVESVLDNLEALESIYLKPKKSGNAK